MQKLLVSNIRGNAIHVQEPMGAREQQPTSDRIYVDKKDLTLTKA